MLEGKRNEWHGSERHAPCGTQRERTTRAKERGNTITAAHDTAESNHFDPKQQTFRLTGCKHKTEHRGMVVVSYTYKVKAVQGSEETLKWAIWTLAFQHHGQRPDFSFQHPENTRAFTPVNNTWSFPLRDITQEETLCNSWLIRSRYNHRQSTSVLLFSTKHFRVKTQYM